MRELKFRAWDKEFNRMIAVMSLTMPEQTRFILVKNGDGNLSLARPREMLEIMQFTGLTDKNGKEIYEGDLLKIVEAHEHGCTCEHCFPFKIGEVLKVAALNDRYALFPAGFIDKEGICEWCSAKSQGLMSENHEIPIGCYAQIVGNIYENPELLK